MLHGFPGNIRESRENPILTRHRMRTGTEDVVHVLEDTEVVGWKITWWKKNWLRIPSSLDGSRVPFGFGNPELGK